VRHGTDTLAILNRVASAALAKLFQDSSDNVNLDPDHVVIRSAMFQIVSFDVQASGVNERRGIMLKDYLNSNSGAFYLPVSGRFGVSSGLWCRKTIFLFNAI